MSFSTPNTSYKSTFSRFRRHSKPTPPERDDQIKKPNMTSSPVSSKQSNIIDEHSASSHYMLPMDPRIHLQQAPSPMIPQQSMYSSPPPPPTSFALQQSDLNNIVFQLKTVLREEIQNTIQSLFKQEIENIIKQAIQSLTVEMKDLKAENEMLRDELDSLEQYSRRDLMRFVGIAETKGEDTTTIVTNIVESIDDEYQAVDIIRSHRVGNPNRIDKSGRKLPPRQIIVRVKDPIVKRRILRCTKNLKESANYANVNINEDLTKRRNALAYMARKLKNAGHVKQTWTVDGKIFLKNRNDRIVAVTNELSFQRFMQHNCPDIAVDFLFSEAMQGKLQSGETTAQPLSYAAAFAATAMQQSSASSS